MKQRSFDKNLALLAAGQGVSLLGNSVLDLALSMYVLECTGSAVVYGSMLAAAMLPAVLLAPLGGVLADRVDRKKLMIWLDLLNGCTVLLAIPFLRGEGGVWAAGVLMVALGILGAVETPVVQAALPQAVAPGALEHANAVVLQISMLSAMAGPALGGVLFGWFGAAPMLLVCGICFLATAGLERLIRLDPVEQPPAAGGILRTLRQDLGAGVRFLCREQPALLRLVGLTAVLAMLCNGVAGVGVCLLPAGVAFLADTGQLACYGALVAAFCGMQLCAVVFSVFARSEMQRRVPGQMLGKLMALGAALETCGQPAGQLLYGCLFDVCPAGWVLLCTGLLVLALGLAGRRSLARLGL